MSDDARKIPNADALIEWDQFLDMLRNSGRESVATLWHPDEAQMRQENYRYLLISLAQGYLMLFHADPDYPDWVTFINSGFPNAGPNPDTIYWYSPIRADGVYRISGTRGSVYYCDIQVAGGMLGMFDRPGPRLSGVDLDTIRIEPDGTFELILSKERPRGYQGNWHQLDPRAMDLCVRQVSYDWVNEVDARLAIERLDVPASKPRVQKEQLSARLKQLVRYVDVWGQFWLKYTRDLRDQNVINRLEQMRVGDDIGGLDEQYYYHGIYDLTPDEALIVETDVPQANASTGTSTFATSSSWAWTGPTANRASTAIRRGSIPTAGFAPSLRCAIPASITGWTRQAFAAGNSWAAGCARTQRRCRSRRKCPWPISASICRPTRR